MNRKKVISIICTLSTCAVVFAALYIMFGLLEQKQEKLLSQRGNIPITEMVSDTGESDENLKSELSMEELKEVISYLEWEAQEEPREPSNDQLTMKQAISEGQQWIVDFIRNNMDDIMQLPESYERITATLCEKQAVTESIVQTEKGNILTKSEDTESDDLFAYWKIEYRSQSVQIVLWLNAVTGQVLRVNMTGFESDVNFLSLDSERILTDYADTFSKGKYFLTGNISGSDSVLAAICFEEEELYAVVHTKSICMTRSDGKEIVESRENTLDLYLCTTSPQFTTQTQVPGK